MPITSTIYVDGVQSNIFPESGMVVSREGMDGLVPTGQIVFRDYLATFINRYPIMQDTEISIAFDDGENNIKHTYLPLTDVKNQLDTAAVDTYQYEMHLISKFAEKIWGESEFHSKRGKASDYVKYIADACGLGYEVEETRNVRSWINPNWKYGNMLRFLAERSESVSGSLGYMFYVRGDSVLVFKSIDALFDEGQEEDIVARLDGQEVDRDLTIRNRLAYNVLMGVNAFYPYYYDLNASEEKQIEAKFDTFIKKRGVSMGVSRKMAEIGENRYYGEFYANGRPTRINKGIYRRVVAQSETTQFTITVPAVLSRKAGDIINVTIPTRDEETNGVSMNYSGRYLLKNLVTMGHGDYFQRLHLVRPGINLDDQRKGNYL